MSIEEAVRGDGVVPVFQPIVSLRNGSIVGYEALARWPHLGTVAPDEVFTHARAIGETESLDRICIEAASERALSSAALDGVLLSLNCEPASSYLPATPGGALSRAKDRFAVMFEITERALLDKPQALLHKVKALRQNGFLIALDDVGASPDSSAMLDVISPDIVKLDLTLVQTQPNGLQAQILSSVIAHHERTGATILAEGIETDEHLEQALALGADLGQGYKFGRPGEIDAGAAMQPWEPFLPVHHLPADTASPFALIEGHHRVRTARKSTVIALSQHIERLAKLAADPPIVLTALQRSEFLTRGTMRRYVELAEHSPLVAIFGLQMPAGLDSGIRGVPLADEDPLCSEWTVVILGPHTAAALIARESAQSPSTLDDLNRRFDFVITYDRGLVTSAAHSLLNRIG